MNLIKLSGIVSGIARTILIKVYIFSDDFEGHFGKTFPVLKGKKFLKSARAAAVTSAELARRGADVYVLDFAEAA